MDTITNRHRGATFVIGGTSPERDDSDWIWSIMKDAIVIGVNRYPLGVPANHCRYWLSCDSSLIQARMPGVLETLSLYSGVCETFYNAHKALEEGTPKPDHWFRRPRGTSVDKNTQPTGQYPIPTTWTGELQHVWTSATAAANLAAIMGASRIILHGVDLIGGTLCLGKVVPWEPMAPAVSHFFKRLPCPVFRTNPRSPLMVPVLI